MCSCILFALSISTLSILIRDVLYAQSDDSNIPAISIIVIMLALLCCVLFCCLVCIVFLFFIGNMIYWVRETVVNKALVKWYWGMERRESIPQTFRESSQVFLSSSLIPPPSP